MPNGPFRWSARAGRYIAADGRFVSREAVRRMLDQAVQGERRAMRAAATTYRGLRTPTLGDLAAFERAMRAGIKTTHILAQTAAAGGFAQMTPSDYGRVGRIVRFHYGKLEGWMRSIADGTAPMDGRFLSRAMLYAGASLGTYYAEAGRTAEETGLFLERNVLGGAEHSCEECVAATAQEWVPIGTLPPIGQRTCLGNCQCTIEYA